MRERKIEKNCVCVRKRARERGREKNKQNKIDFNAFDA